MMHVVVTAIVVLFTLISVYSIGLGLMKSTEHKFIGSFSLVCAILITLSGILTPVAMANDIMISGLLERINIFSIQTWIFVLSIYLYFYTKKKLNEQR